MSEQQINHNNYPYQVINGEVYDLNIPRRPLRPGDFLTKKPLVPLLEYLKSKGININETAKWYYFVIKLGDLEALQWIISNGTPLNTNVCSYAAEYGHLKILQWARANGAPWNEFTCAYAANKGHLEILKWARAAGAPWDETTCSYAAYNGHLEVIQWARDNGAPWDDNVCFDAYNMHPKVLKWAYLNGCPCQDIEEQKAQQLMLKSKDINWVLSCKERWNEDKQELFSSMIDQVVNGCHKVTYDLLPTCLSNLVVNYL